MRKRIWKRMLAAFLIAVSLCSPAANAFTGAAQCSPWASLYLSDAEDLIFSKDMSNVDFRKPISRLEFAEMVYEAMGYMAGYTDYYTALQEANANGENFFDTHGYTMPKIYPPAGELCFSDTDSIPVSALNRAGILLGKSESHFAPEDILTRQEAATVLSRISAYFSLQSFPMETAFTDAGQISPWAREGAEIACGMGLMLGMADGSFSPQTQLTREQAVAVLIRLIDSVPYLLNKTQLGEGLVSRFNLMWMWVEDPHGNVMFYLPLYWPTYDYRPDYGYSNWDFIPHESGWIVTAWGKSDPAENANHTTLFDLRTGESILSLPSEAGTFYALTADKTAMITSNIVMSGETDEWGTTYYGVYGFDGRQLLSADHTWEDLYAAGYVNTNSSLDYIWR